MKCKLKVATNVTGRSFGYGFASLKYVAWQNGTRKRTKVQAERGASGAQMQLCEVPGMSGQLLSQDIYLIQNKSLETQLADRHLTATKKKKKNLYVESGLQMLPGGLIPFVLQTHPNTAYHLTQDTDNLPAQ